MNGCDDERCRMRQEIAARVARIAPTPETMALAQALQDAYQKRRRDYLNALYPEGSAAQPETAPGQTSESEAPSHTPAEKLLL